MEVMNGSKKAQRNRKKYNVSVVDDTEYLNSDYV